MGTQSTHFRFGGFADHSNSENTHNYSLYQKTGSPHSRLRWMSLLKPFASKRFTLASPPGEVFPMIKFSLFFWRKCCFLKMDYNLLFNISLCFLCLSNYLIEELLTPSVYLSWRAARRQQLESMPLLPLRAAAVKGKKSWHCVRSTFLSPRRHTCWHHHHPLGQKFLACYQVGASLLALGQTTALPELWSSPCYGGVKHPVRKRMFLLKRKTQIIYFIVRRLGRNMAKSHIKPLCYLHNIFPGVNTE